MVTLPFDVPSNFFPPNGTGSSNGGSNGFQGAVLSGDLTVPAGATESISFSIAADDMAFAYLNGQVICDLGGVHSFSPGTCITPSAIGPGTYPIEVFFVDMDPVQAGLEFGITTSGVATTPTPSAPEPATLPAVGIALIGIVIAKGYFVHPKP